MTATRENTLAAFWRSLTTKEGVEAFIREHNDCVRNFNACESPIEHDFLHFLYKVKSDEVNVVGQVGCHTRIGRFRMDFVIKDRHRRIGIECDGRSFHDKNKDQIRDEAILDTRTVDAIYRIPGRCQWFYPYEVLDLLRLNESFVFSDRGTSVLDRVLDDGKERDDSWEANQVIRTLKRPQSQEEDEIEEGQDQYDDYIGLHWTTK